MFSAENKKQRWNPTQEATTLMTEAILWWESKSWENGGLPEGSSPSTQIIQGWRFQVSWAQSRVLEAQNSFDLGFLMIFSPLSQCLLSTLVSQGRGGQLSCRLKKQTKQSQGKEASWRGEWMERGRKKGEKGLHRYSDSMNIYIKSHHIYPILSEFNTGYLRLWVGLRVNWLLPKTESLWEAGNDSRSQLWFA